jgi:signal peptidase
MTNLRNISRFFLVFFLSVLTVLFLFTLFPFNKTIQLFAVESGSMQPAIPLGSLVVTSPQATYSPSEVITFYSGNTVATHRIVATEDASYITKGDANKTNDPRLVTPEMVIGKVLFSVPYLGYGFNIVRTPIGFLSVVVIPALLLIADELWFIGKELSKLRRRTVATVFVLLGLSSLMNLNTTSAGYVDTEQSTANLLQSVASYGITSGLFESNDFTCDQGASTTTSQFGTIVIDMDTNTLYLDVTLEGAAPNTAYDVWVNQDPGACPLSEPTFTAGLNTENNGDAHATFQVARIGGANNFWISAVGGGQVLRSQAHP